MPINISFLCAFSWTTLLYVILAFAVLLLMVLIHELGHYVAGRLLKFKIEEFSVGFGKAIFSRTNKRGEKISLRIFPLGGYCAFAGENEQGDGKDPHAFCNQKPWKRIIVLFMGAFFNFLSAIIFSFILLLAFGYDIRQVQAVPAQLDCYVLVGQEYEPTTVENINANNANFLQAGDVIYYVNGNKMDFAFGDTLENALANADKTKPVTFGVVDANGKEQTRTANFNVTTDSSGNKVYQMGFTYHNYKHSFVQALARCVPFAVGLAWLVLKCLWLLITFQLPISSIGGPVTTIATIATMTQQNIASLFVLLPLISANLAAFNLLPFPALDGAQIVFTSIEWIRRKPLNKKIQNAINTAGLFILFGFVIVVDILHFVL